jgi:hypothetical protein
MSRSQRVAVYRRFVPDGLKDGHREDLYEIVDQRYLGDDAFVDKVEQRGRNAKNRRSWR